MSSRETDVYFSADVRGGMLVEHQNCMMEFIWLDKYSGISNRTEFCPHCGVDITYPEGASW